MLTAKIGSTLWSKMSLLQRSSDIIVQSLNLLDVAGKTWRKRTGRSVFHRLFVYKTPVCCTNRILSTMLN